MGGAMPPFFFGAWTMKHHCETCPFWEKHTEQPASAIIQVNNKPMAQGAAGDLGNCMKEPPAVAMIPMQGGGVDPRAITFMQRMYWPVTVASGGCSHHPEVVAAKAKRVAYVAIDIYKNWLEYDPAKHPELDGLSRIPRLSELPKIADVSQREENKP